MALDVSDRRSITSRPNLSKQAYLRTDPVITIFHKDGYILINKRLENNDPTILCEQKKALKGFSQTESFSLAFLESFFVLPDSFGSFSALRRFAKLEF